MILSMKLSASPTDGAAMPITDFQPLFPEERVLGPLREQAAALIAAAHRLAATQPALVAALQPLLRAMNSYYTNRIEGQHTLPADIERALHRQFDADVTLARRQRLALAHMEAEAELEARVTAAEPGGWLYGADFVASIHAALYARLPVEDRRRGDDIELQPGVWRDRQVIAGQHLAPPSAEIPALLEVWGQRYRGLSGGESRVIGALCAHHRLLWIHPFLDGNGRSARLHTHIVLHALGLTQGLWSPMRGFARAQEQYYARLNNADLERRNDLDGRGSLSQEGLIAFVAWALEVCLDQVRFIGERLHPGGFRERLQALLLALAARPWPVGSETSVVRPEALGAVHYVALNGALPRGEFLAMTGLPERTARRMLASLLDYGLLAADSPRAPVRFALPQKSLGLLFPRLWPEAEQMAPD